MAVASGPLHGLKVVEFAALGPASMGAMMLADQGAEVISIDRLEPSGMGIPRPPQFDVCRRGRKSLALDLKRPEGRDAALRLVSQVDGLIEGFRPGVMERLGLGPDDCLRVNPRLAYGRITGWGQDGPLAQTAGHDLNYLALSGVLPSIGRKDQPPTIPLNLVADFGGGAMFLAFGLVCAMLEARWSGKGQVVDAAMSEGAALLASSFYGLHAAGIHSLERGGNILDSGAPFYEVYRCADGEWISLAAIELKFRSVFLKAVGLDLDPAVFDDTTRWPQLKAALAELFVTRTRAEWSALFEGTDACVAPVLSPRDAPDHPQHVARKAFVTLAGVTQPAPAPRFSRTPAAEPTPPDRPGASSAEILTAWGFDQQAIDGLSSAGIIPAPITE